MKPSTGKGKVLVAMSGGVDSSVAAALLLRDGYDVVGCFMRLGSPGEDLPGEGTPGESSSTTGTSRRTISLQQAPVKIGHQGCCSINDAADARMVAGMLNVPFYVCNFKQDFSRIIHYFANEYACGRTPNPCVRCNDWLKFGKLHEYATQIGADFVASGHYARIGTHAGSPALLRGIDAGKDQSYVLFGVPRAHLSRTLLPIGGMEKPAVRALAQEFGLPVFDKPDSQEICFVPDNDYAGLVERVLPKVRRPGEIRDARGTILGTHEGQHRFTIGQRRGLSIALGERVYVTGKDAASNVVTVGDASGLLKSTCVASEANWLIDVPEPCTTLRVLAKYRYNTPAATASVRLLHDGNAEGVTPQTPSGRSGRFEVVFDAPQQAVAPGQAIVLYDEREPDVVLGGGWIEGAE